VARRRVTIHDVAAKAGVSYATVSRVLNDKDSVRDETRAAVLKAVAELDYVPDPIARSLATKQTAMIGFVVSDITNPFLADVARGIQRVADARGYSVTICVTENDTAHEIRAIRFLAARRADGLIVTPPESEESDKLIGEVAEAGTPFLLIGRHLPHERASTVSTSTTAGAYTATSYLLKQGHRRIAHIQASPRMGYGRGKLRGYSQALQEHGLDIDPQLIVASDYSVAGGQRAAESLLSLASPPTAIFATNDLTAIGALAAAEGLGLQVPRDLSVVGFDDIIFARSTRPPLTTVAQPALKLGETAANMLLQMIRGESVPQEVILDCALIVRESTAPPRSRPR